MPVGDSTSSIKWADRLAVLGAWQEETAKPDPWTVAMVQVSFADDLPLAHLHLHQLSGVSRLRLCSSPSSNDSAIRGSLLSL